MQSVGVPETAAATLPVVEAPPAWMVTVWLEASAWIVPLVVTAPAAVMATLPASDSRAPLQVTVPLLVASMVRAASAVTAASAMAPAASMSTVWLEAVAWIAPRIHHPYCSLLL